MNLLPRHNTASSRVFEVPELLHLICSFAPISDCARVSRTCRTGLRVSAALVWHYTDGRSLLSLLDVTETSRTNKDTGNKIKVMSLPWFSQVIFSRFDFYTPYIRKVEVYGARSTLRPFRVEGWEALTIRARQRPLLPFLSQIHLLLDGDDDNDIYQDDAVAWIGTFASPTLSEVHVKSTSNRYPTHLPLLAADVILDAVARSCPQLRKLSLFPTRTLGMAPRPLDKLLGFLWRRTYYESLSSLITLVELTCSATMLENDSVLIVGSLPMLRRLTIVGPIIPVIPDSDVFSMDSFPALRQLHLAGSHEYANGLARILSISALMSRLTRLELEYWPEDDLSFHPDTMDVLVESGAFEQLRNAPHLRSLAFRVDPEERATPYDIGHLDLMETFSGLSLETIVLTGVKASAWMSDVNRFREVWMNMTRVSMPDQLGSHSVLECFAQLPRLRYLKIKLFLEAAGDYDPEDLSMCLLNTLESSAGGIVPIEPEHLKPLGDYLLELFPDLDKVVWPRGREEGGQRPDQLMVARRRFVGFLNHYITLKHEVNGLRSELETVW